MQRTALISIVDDNDSVRGSLRAFFRSIGFEVETFASAEAFLASRSPRDPDCLILDVRMPGMSGLELQRRLAARQSRVPVIFITAHGDEELRTRALDDGAAEYLFKPFSEQALLNAVQTAVGSM